MDITGLRQKLEMYGLLPLRAQADKWTALLTDKLDTVLPSIMKEQESDLWLVMCKENGEDPIFKTLVTWDLPSARRLSVLAFFKDQKTNEITRYILGGSSPEMNKLYTPYPTEKNKVWEGLNTLITEKAPRNILLNYTEGAGFIDGLTYTLHEDFLANLSTTYHKNIKSAAPLAIRWLQTVTSAERETMKVLTEVTHDIINATFSTDFIAPGETTTTEVEWEMRDIISTLGFDFWFGPDVDVQRKGDSRTRIFNTPIEKGDLLHCDIGLVGRFIPLHTDVQHLAYVCKDEEETTPEEIQSLLQTCNHFQDIVTEKFKVQKTGNEIFMAAYAHALEKGINPMLYTHPLGTFGHGAGPSIGMYDNQGFVKGSGELAVYDHTCYALELNISKPLKIWDEQVVYAYLEEDIHFAGQVTYLSGRQTTIPALKYR